MKITFQLLTLAILSLAFSSCCGLFSPVGSMKAQKEVTKYYEGVRTIEGAKGSYQVREQIPITTTQTVRKFCRKCGSSYCPKPQCCGILSPEVLARATSQGGTGEPQIGLIPTMKPLAE